MSTSPDVKFISWLQKRSRKWRLAEICGDNVTVVAFAKGASLKLGAHKLHLQQVDEGVLVKSRGMYFLPWPNPDKMGVMQGSAIAYSPSGLKEALRDAAYNVYEMDKSARCKEDPLELL